MASDIGKFGVNSRHRKKMNLVLNSIIVLLVLTLIWIESGALVSKAAPETSVEEPATATTTMKAQSSAAGNWSSLYDLTPDQQALFFEQRRMEYSHRRDRIQSLCASISEDDPSHKFLHNIVFPKNLIYAPDHNVAYCQIAKVGSSTWTLHFVHLANPPQEEVDKHMQAVQVYAPALWPLPKDVKLEALAEEFQHELTALVVNRHPFSRLTSAYFQKVIDAGTYSKPWIKFNQRVIEQHRSEARKKEIEATAEVEDFEFAGDDPKFPSPEEFLLQVLAEFKSGSFKQVDPHWQPQHVACPFCRLNFSVYARIEDAYEDTAYFMQKANVLSKIKDVDLIYNKGTKGGGAKKYKEFWRRVSPEMIRKLYHHYKLDFRLFGFTLEDYFIDNDLVDMLDKVGLE